MFIVWAWLFSVGARRDNHLHAGCLSLFGDSGGIVAFIGEKMAGGKPLGQWTSLCAICDGTCRNNDSERHTMRIHGQM